jgi:hypothetical protein
MGLGSGIRKKPIPDPGSWGQKGTGSRIRIRNTGFPYYFCLMIEGSGVGFGSGVGSEPYLRLTDPRSQEHPDPQHCFKHNFFFYNRWKKSLVVPYPIFRKSFN